MSAESSRFTCGSRQAKRVRRILLITAGVVLALLTACAPRYSMEARSPGSAGGGQADLPRLERESAGKPGNARLKQRLGAALFEAGRIDEAESALKDAAHLDPGSRETHYFLARVAESRGDIESALASYAAYIDRGGSQSSVIRDRIETLTRERLRQEAEAAVLAAEQGRFTSIPENTLAVSDFVNLASDRKLSPLSRALAYWMISDLGQVRELCLLERQKINVLLDELSRAQQPVVRDSAGASRAAGGPTTPLPAVMDPASAPRLGQLLGARRLVQGAFLGSSEEGRMELRADLIGVPDGASSSAGAPVMGPLDRVMHLQKLLVEQTLRSLGFDLPPAARKKLRKVPTESLEAYLCFGRGLLFEDAGLRAEAAEAYREAIQQDPSFEEARIRESIVSVTPEDGKRADRVERGRLDRSQPSGPREGMTVTQVIGRGLGGGAETTEAFRPDKGDAMNPWDSELTKFGAFTVVHGRIR